MSDETKPAPDSHVIAFHGAMRPWHPIIGARYRGHRPDAWGSPEVMRAVLGARRVSKRREIANWVASKVIALHTFASVYRQYRVMHSRKYAVRIAYGVAFKGLPF